MSNPFGGPTPPYNNPPINPQYFQPSKFYISSITLGQTTLVTATTDMNYVVGQSVRLLIPPYSGCTQLNEQQGIVIDIPDTDQVVLNINSLRNVNTFISTSEPNQPQIVAIGDTNSGIISSTGQINSSTNIPGSFINISPQ